MALFDRVHVAAWARFFLYQPGVGKEKLGIEKLGLGMSFQLGQSLPRQGQLPQRLLWRRYGR